VPKAGRYEYPGRDLDDCVAYLTNAYKVSKSDIMKRETFAQALNMAPRGGGFIELVGSMAEYGLVETGNGQIQYTDLAKGILFGEPPDQAQGKQKAVRSVPIFADIYDRYGSNCTDEQLRLFLRDKASVDISKVGDTATELGKLYRKVVNYLGTPTEAKAPSQPRTGMIDLVEGYGSVTTAFGTIKVLNSATLEIARKLLDAIEAEMKKEEARSIGSSPK